MIPRISEALRLWSDNQAVLAPVCVRIADAFGLPAQAVEDTIRRRLVMDVAEGRSQYRPNLPWTIAALGWLLLQLLAAVIVPRKRRRWQGDVLLDHWGADNFLFYRDALTRLKGARVAVLSREPHAANYPDDLPVICRKNASLYPPAIAARALPLLLRSFFATLLGRRQEVSAFYVAVILLRKIGLYFADMDGLKATVFLSSGDNYFEGLRHAVYRRAGAESIHVIQNGVRGAWISDVYLYSDVYYSMGEDIAAAIPGHRAGEVIPVGSIRAAEQMRILGVAGEPRFDIAFVEQLFDVDVDGTGSMAAYDRLVEHMARFAREHPHLNLCIATRPLREQCDSSLSRRRDRFDAIMADTGVVYSHQQGLTSYGAVAAARLAVAYSSTLATEATLFGRPFLYCCPDDLLFLNGDGPAFLHRPSYEQIRDRILQVLAAAPDENKDYYTATGRRYVIPEPNPGMVIGDSVQRHIEKSKCQS